MEDWASLLPETNDMILSTITADDLTKLFTALGALAVIILQILQRSKTVELHEKVDTLTRAIAPTATVQTPKN